MKDTKYIHLHKPGHPNASPKGAINEHVFVMSEILGRPLTALEVVHHRDGDPKNNLPSNLMLCTDQAAHLLQHAKERALEACGNSKFMKCPYCKKYDNPLNMRVRNDRYSAYHIECKAAANKAYRTK